MSRYYEALVQDAPSEVKLPSDGLIMSELESHGRRYRMISTVFGTASILASFAYYHYLSRRK